MAQLSQSRQALESSGAAIYAISNEQGAELKAMRDRHKLDFVTFLSNPEGKLMQLYPGAKPGETAATFVINKDKKISYSYINDDYTTRANTDAVLKTLAEIQ